MVDRIVIPRPFDAHVHLREGMMLEDVVRFTAEICSRANAMPNLRVPITEAELMLEYHERILRLTGERWPKFSPQMTVMLTPQTTPEMLVEAKKAGAVLAKGYPRGVTTNSDHGIEDFFALGEQYDAMADIGLPFSAHGEVPTADMLEVTNTERNFIPTLLAIAKQHPRLKIILEHVSTIDGVMAILRSSPNVVGTITAHHLMLTINDVAGRPHNYCKPVACSYEDRAMLRKVVLETRSPKFWFGSDTAWHTLQSKQSVNPPPPAGISSALVAVELITQLFAEAHGDNPKLPTYLANFLCRNAESFFGLEPTNDELVLLSKSFIVPMTIHRNYVPFMAGQQIAWSVEGRRYDWE